MRLFTRIFCEYGPLFKHDDIVQFIVQFVKRVDSEIILRCFRRLKSLRGKELGRQNEPQNGAEQVREELPRGWTESMPGCKGEARSLRLGGQARVLVALKRKMLKSVTRSKGMNLRSRAGS